VEFEDLYSAYADDVYRYALSLCGNPSVAEDVTSETFLKAIRSINKFKGECEVRVWLCKIAKNTFFTLAKKNKFAAEMPENLSSGDNLEHKLIDKSEALKIHKLLHDLGEPHKEVFSLRVFSELSFTEIGALFGKPDNWARVTFHRAKTKLKEGLNDD